MTHKSHSASSRNGQGYEYTKLTETSEEDIMTNTSRSVASRNGQVREYEETTEEIFIAIPPSKKPVPPEPSPRKNAGLIAGLLLAGTSCLLLGAYLARCPLFGICPPPPPLPDNTQSVQAYSATVPVWRYLYSATELHAAVSEGWHPEGSPFVAFSQQQPGTVPLYRHTAPDPWRSQLSTQAAIGNGWTNEGVVFYVYARPQDKPVGMKGTLQPIYQYYAVDSQGKWRYFYSPDANVGNGWKNTGVAFYALSNAQ